MSATHYLAVDLGAESGRVILGTLKNGLISIEELHRFVNRSLEIDGHLHWDLAHLEKEIFAGLEKAGRQGHPISGVSADSWGVDYVLLNEKGRALAQPYSYRDLRTADSPARLSKTLPFACIYGETGIQFMAINTIYQMEAQQYEDATILSGAGHFLSIADYFNAWFSGVEVAEESMASTTQLYNPKSRAWSDKLVSALGLPKTLFPPIVPSGTVLGPVTGEIKSHSAFACAEVIATCSHDTGAAVAGVPASDTDNWAYLSSGTWSLLGVELPAPIISEAACGAGFTNEAGLGGTTRFLKNIAGLWVVQECRRAWETAGIVFTYSDLTRLALESGPAQSHLELSDSRFVSSGDMPNKIAAYCRETAQMEPETPGQFIRSILESLAVTYAHTLRQLQSLIGHEIDTLHIVGGGSRNELLNQLTANATGLTVIAGPIEATAAGNILIQALALGHIESPAQLRRTVAASFDTVTYTPNPDMPAELLPAF